MADLLVTGRLMASRLMASRLMASSLMASRRPTRRRPASRRSERPGGRHRRPAPPRRRLSGRAGTVMGVVIVACGALAAAIGVTGLAVTGGPRRTAVSLPEVSHVRIPSGPVSARPAAGQVARPTVLIIPAIGVQARLVRLGVMADGALQVPSGTAIAGWYQGSPRPGDVGASVIAGHVDSYRGPGVFFRLRLLHPPERVYVRRADGTLAAFRVVAVQTYDKSRFPTAAVYGPAPGPQLRLITCGGTFDPGLGSYLSNVIVFAVAAS